MPPIRLTQFIPILILVICLGGARNPLIAQAESDDFEFLPGLIATIQNDTSPAISRLDPTLQFAWQAEPIDWRLSPTALASGSTKLKWHGLLHKRGSGEVQFSIYTNGLVKLRIDGQELAPVPQAPTPNSPGHANTPLASEQPDHWIQFERWQLKAGMRELEIELELTGAPADFGLYWAGDNFNFEPVPSHVLWHSVDSQAPDEFQNGQILSRGLRCAACHTYNDTQPVLPGPSLENLNTNLRPSWLVNHLQAISGNQAESDSEHLSQRRMPYFGLHANDAAAISAALFQASGKSTPPPNLQAEIKELNAARGKKDTRLPTEADPAAGGLTFASVGCVSCHQIADLGGPKSLSEAMFSGGDLSLTATKRTREFLLRWLSDPASVNRHHRMPAFELSPNEILNLTAYLSHLGQEKSRQDTQAYGDAARGQGLIHQHRCAACHALPAALANANPSSAFTKTPLTATSNWEAGCLGPANPRAKIPGFQLSAEQQQALKLYITGLASPKAAPSGGDLLVENNCLACHSRNNSVGLEKHAADIVAEFPDLAASLAGLMPPSLNSIGDKLHPRAIRDSIRLTAEPQRPWLSVRMPKFHLSDASLESIATYFVDHDRIPANSQLESQTTAGELHPGTENPATSDLATQLAAGRLVTGDGFGCQSCHSIGQAEAPKVDLKARGPNLAMLGDRIRGEWFQRWVRDPARIVPRMEMPAIKVAARGLLDDSLDLQLTALWDALNTPGFRPPTPNPTTIVRARNLPDEPQRPQVLTDVFEIDDVEFLRPIVLGLDNRHNVLFDLQRGSLAKWWMGDTAYQRTRGKTWYWEPGNAALHSTSELQTYTFVEPSGRTWIPDEQPGAAIELSGMQVTDTTVTWTANLNLSSDAAANAQPQRRQVLMRSTVEAAPAGFRLTTTFSGLPPETNLIVQTPSQATGQLGTAAQMTLEAAFQGDGKFLVKSSQQGDARVWQVRSRYSSLIPADQFHLAQPPPIRRPQALLKNVPGFDALQLPMPIHEMPISLAWDPEGRLFVGSLKGNILEAIDTDADGLVDDYIPVTGNVPTPYGLWAGKDHLDVLTKSALWRLEDRQGHFFQKQVVLADDWGYSHDYHDWAVGLERDPHGNYYVALPCQQDDRSPVAAHRRGTAFKLVPSSSGQHYTAQHIAGGLRFPMGIALNPAGELFTSDNQGNYNPFNELNHLRQDKRYGFINKLENRDGFSPDFESPAINVPHPWTRSVNGICFLTTPENLSEAGKPLYGAFEGHLIGCEMNGRSLVRMSLQRVGETYQGAVYAFSKPAGAGELEFEGPIVCEVAPDGDVYIGNLQDSGWGGGQNTGSLVRLHPTGELAHGIAEVRGTHTGFEIDFTQPVSSQEASQVENYTIRSYRRISTPIYGGEDQDSRSERIAKLELAESGKSVRLELDALREGFVYEISVTLHGLDGSELFPQQAHYTMRSIPQDSTAAAQ